MNDIKGYAEMEIYGEEIRFKYTLKVENDQLWLYFDEQDVAILVENDRVELSDITRRGANQFSCITHPRFLVLEVCILIYTRSVEIADQLEEFINRDWNPFIGKHGIDWEFGTVFSVGARRAINHERVRVELLIFHHRKQYDSVCRELLIFHHRKKYNLVFQELKEYKPRSKSNPLEKKKGWFSWLW